MDKENVYLTEFNPRIVKISNERARGENIEFNM